MSIRRRLALMIYPELGRAPAARTAPYSGMSKPLERATRDAFGWERAQFLDVEAARRNAREPLRQLPRVMIPFEAVRRCIDAVRFPTLLMGPELEKWLSQHVERLDGISCPSRLQRAQLGAARWLTEAPEPEFEATEGAPEDGPALSGDDAELSALLQGRPELDEAEARRAIERLGQRFPTPHGEPRPSHAGRVHRKSQGVR
jgi:hypothetical protein